VVASRKGPASRGPAHDEAALNLPPDEALQLQEAGALLLKAARQLRKVRAMPPGADFYVPAMAAIEAVDQIELARYHAHEAVRGLVRHFFEATQE